jgi:hypothetical protein
MLSNHWWNRGMDHLCNTLPYIFKNLDCHSNKNACPLNAIPFFSICFKSSANRLSLLRFMTPANYYIPSAWSVNTTQIGSGRVYIPISIHETINTLLLETQYELWEWTIYWQHVWQCIPTLFAFKYKFAVSRSFGIIKSELYLELYFFEFCWRFFQVLVTWWLLKIKHVQITSLIACWWKDCLGSSGIIKRIITTPLTQTSNPHAINTNVGPTVWQGAKNKTAFKIVVVFRLNLYFSFMYWTYYLTKF